MVSARFHDESGLLIRVVRTFIEVQEVQSSEENFFAVGKCQTMPELPVLDLTWAPAPPEEEHEEEEEVEEKDEDEVRLTVRVVRTFLEFEAFEVRSEENSFAIHKCQTMPELPVLDLTWAPAPPEEEHEEEEETKEGVALDVQCRPMPLLPSLGIEPESDMEALREKAPVADRVDKCTPTPLPMKDMVTSGDAGDHAPLTQVPVPAAPAQRPDPSSWPFPARMVQEHLEGRCYPCLFFTRNGCRMGDDCTHCHVCAPSEVRRRRNRVALEMKRAKKAAALQGGQCGFGQGGRRSRD